MTPQERQLVTELFDRLATLEGEKRDLEAEKAIGEGLKRAPNAVYALVQTVLVQDQALRDADARIRDLERDAPADSTQGGFLDNMRSTLFGRQDAARGSVPLIPPAAADWRGANPQPASAAPTETEHRPQGGSFLGTAAAAAAGVIGGSLLLDGIRSMMGGGRHAGMLDSSAGNARDTNPWGGNSTDSDLARQAGIDDLGRNSGSSSGDAGGTSAGLFDTAEADSDGDRDDFDSDFDIGGDSDFA